MFDEQHEPLSEAEYWAGIDKANRLTKRVLVACEFSGVVRDAFIDEGYDAYSCDLEPSESDRGPHHLGDVREILSSPGWDLVIAFPPCTFLASSGARWWAERCTEQVAAVEFVRQIMVAGAPRIAVENPVGKLSKAICKPDQIIQPWQHGHGETKATCLWLKNLPLLQPTEIVEGRASRVHRMPASKTRQKDRSRTYPGIARAMARQWGAVL